MKVKVIKRFNDIKERKIQEVGNILEVTEARAEWLVSQGMVEKCQETKEVPAGQQEPKETKNTAKPEKEKNHE